MKKYIFALIAVCTIGTTFAQVIFWKKRNKIKQEFVVKEDIVFFNEKPIAKYQAKTYSLDGGELVEEYNLLLLDNQIQNKQVIGDLIDFVSDRHRGAEVEIEIEGKNSIFNL